MAGVGVCKKLNCGPIWLLVALLFLAVSLNLAHTQVSTAATILGTFTDSSGAVFADASTTVSNTGTGATRTAVTDAQGRYTATPVVVGTYHIQAEMIYAIVEFQTLNNTYSAEFGGNRDRK